jgi:hypothetical protein
MATDRPDTPDNEAIGQHLLVARNLAKKLNSPLLVHIIDMALLDIYGEGDGFGEGEKGESPISKEA